MSYDYFLFISTWKYVLALPPRTIIYKTTSLVVSMAIVSKLYRTYLRKVLMSVCSNIFAYSDTSPKAWLSYQPNVEHIWPLAKALGIDMSPLFI